MAMISAAISSIVFMLLLKETFSCEKTASRNKFEFSIGILSPQDGNSPLKNYMLPFLQSDSPEIEECYKQTSIVTLNVEMDLAVPMDGWTKIQERLKSAVNYQSSVQNLTLIVGPFYQNIAMITSQKGIPYIVTDSKGFDWVDVDLVRSGVKWPFLLEIKPPPSKVNQAVVDLCKSRKWESLVVVQPEEANDNQECKDLVIQLIESQISPIPYSISETSTQEQSTELIRNAQMLGIKVIVVCSPRDEKQQLIKTILEKAKAFRFLAEKDKTIVLLDTSFYLKPLEEINMYRQQYYAAQCELLAFRYKQYDITESETWDSSFQATAEDAAMLINKAQKKFLSYIPDGSGKDNQLNQTVFFKALKSVSISDGLTGDIEFGTDGKRKNYTLYLYKYGGSSLYQQVGTWRPIESYRPEAYKMRFVESYLNESEGQNTRSIFSNPVKVVVVTEDPFVMLKDDDSLTGNDRFEGFTIDLLKELSKLLQIEYEIYVSPNNAYGGVNSFGIPDGIVGEVFYGNATFGMGAISITSAREKVIDFSLGVLSTGVNILVPRPQKIESMFQFMQPFSLKLWLAIIGGSVTVSLIYFFLDYSNEDRQFTAKETLWFSIGTLLMRGTDFSPRRTSQRILTAGFTFFVLITVSTYTANLAAFLTTKNLEKPIANLEELAENSDLKCSTINNSATMRFIKNGETEAYREIWWRIQEYNGLVRSANEGREKVESGDFALIYDYLINAYAEKMYCGTKMVGVPIRLQEHGIAIQQGAPFKTALNIALLKLKEDNIIAQLKTKWWDNKRRCEEDDTRSTNVEFNINHMAGVFIVGGFGMACSVAFFLFKKFYLLAKRDNKMNDSDSKSKTESLLDTDETNGKCDDRTKVPKIASV